MKGSKFIANYLVNHGVTDAFGIPGGVVLDLLYAMDAEGGITPHLCYHEQAAGFAAIGYAQASGKLGVSYATRGPGFTNLITPIAEAYSESLPVLFITGHATPALNKKMRVMADQEIDTCAMVSGITKFAYRLEAVDELPEVLEKAYSIAVKGRKGPVVLDIATKVFLGEVNYDISEVSTSKGSVEDVRKIVIAIKNAKRPVLLIGDGVNQAQKRKEVRQLANIMQIPVLSSRFSHDVLCDNELYFGYIGSHGIRYANFVLSKADLIIAMGNRLHFPVKSASYSQVTDKAKIIRIDIDSTEFEREVPNSLTLEMDLSNVVNEFLNVGAKFGSHQEWIEICNTLRTVLNEEDINSATRLIEGMLHKIPCDVPIVADVGNNEFWLSRACVHSNYKGRVMYSKSYGSLGCGICKAIGTYYATKKPVVCFSGDQGFQMNMQELQFIAQHQLPILIVLMNNSASGMIKDKEKMKYGMYVHTTVNSGYSNPNFKRLAETYGLSYTNITEVTNDMLPCILELEINPEEGLTPSLPAGKSIQDMAPLLDRETYIRLCEL